MLKVLKISFFYVILFREVTTNEKTIKILCVIFSAFFIMSLCGCTNPETKNVIALIDNIGEINEHSQSQIDMAQKAYNALDEKDKKDVSNIEDLYSAQKAFEEYIPKYVSAKVSDYRFSDTINYDELKQFVFDYYNYLDDEQTEIESVK